MYSYGDIQRKYDKPLKKNSEYSVFILPEKISYFNPYTHYQSTYSEEFIRQYLVNMCYIYDNTDSTLSFNRRLLMTKDAFPLVITESFFRLVDEAKILYYDSEDRFVPNAVAQSIRNPYYRFGSNITKPKMKKVRMQHRSELKELYLQPEIDHKIYEFLQDYDLKSGLLSKNKIIRELGTSRRILERCLKRTIILTDMFKAIRKESRSKSYQKRLFYESRNDIPNGKHTAETI